MQKNLFEHFGETKKRLEQSLEAGELNTKLFAEFVEQAVQIRAEAYGGKIVSASNPDITWVVHDYVDPGTYEKKTYADAYMTFDQLGEFSCSPYDFVPEGAEPGMVFVFTVMEDFIKEIAPRVLDLHQTGAPYVSCFMWDGKNYAPYEAVEIIHRLASLVKEPARYKKLKKSFRDKNIYDIDDLEYLRNLKRIAEAM